MAFKKKDYYLKPGEIITAENAELGVKYHAAVPLREYWWRPISSCCRAPIQRDIIVDVPVQEESEGFMVAPPVDLAATPTCSKCRQQCEKVWTTKSKLIPCLSREDAGRWHQLDDKR